jgi:hypothetical protein
MRFRENALAPVGGAAAVPNTVIGRISPEDTFNVPSANRGRWWLPLAGRWRITIFLLFLLAYCAFPNARPDFSSFNANDSEVYLALSFNLTHGLGYTRSFEPGAYIAHTTWPPGIPLLLAPVTTFTHLPLDWLSVKLPVILIGVFGVGLTWFYVLRVTSIPATADLAAALVALSPFYWHFSRMDMSEVPSFFFIMGSLVLIDIVWVGRAPRYWQAALLGLFVGGGMLIRGTLIGLALAPLGYLLERRRPLLTPSQQLHLWTIYSFTFCIPFLAWITRNHIVNTGQLGTDGINQIRMLLVASPFDPTSPLLSLSGHLRGLVSNLAYHMIYHIPEQVLPALWLINWQNWAGAPLLAAALTIGLALGATPVRGAGVPLFVTVMPYFLLMCIYIWGGSSRFWIPITSLVTVLLVIRFGPWLMLRSQNLRRGFIVSVLAIYIANLAVYIKEHEQRPFLGDLGDLFLLFQSVRALPDAPVATLTDHQAVYTLVTGYSAPLTNPNLGLEPRYSHVIARSYPLSSAKALPPPSGSVRLLGVGQWTLYKLPNRMTQAEIEHAH